MECNSMVNLAAFDRDRKLVELIENWSYSTIFDHIEPFSILIDNLWLIFTCKVANLINFLATIWSDPLESDDDPIK